MRVEDGLVMGQEAAGVRRRRVASAKSGSAPLPADDPVIDVPEPVAPHPVLDELIGRFDGMKTLSIDPAAARRLLATNTGNRSVSQRRVAQLAAQMRAGHFENTGEAIVISDEGILNNGQHRLLAVIEADVPVEMDLRFGIPRRAFVKTDTGASRSGADVLSIRGVSSAMQTAKAIRLVIAYERGLPEHLRDSITNDEINRGFDRWPDMAEAVAKVQVYRFPAQVRSAPLYAATFLAMRAPKASGLDDWLKMLATGLEAHNLHPAYQLRERLMSDYGHGLSTRDQQLLRFALMIKSWMLFRQGEEVPMREFRWSATGRDAEPFPKVSGARLS